MIYEGVKGILLAVLQAPGEPPKPPAGSPGSVQVFRASPQFLTYKLALIGIFFGVLTVIPTVLAFGMLLSRGTPSAVKVMLVGMACAFAALGMLAYFITRLEYDLRYYLITDRSLRVREGVWTINEVTLTYANVQHLEIRQGPIQQMLGIADLIVRTAGGAGLPAVPEQAGQLTGHRGALRGIDNAEEIRDLINRHLKHYRHAGLGDPEERRRSHPPAAQLDPAAIALLRDIRDELAAWRGTGTAIQTQPPRAV